MVTHKTPMPRYYTDPPGAGGSVLKCIKRTDGLPLGTRTLPVWPRLSAVRPGLPLTLPVFHRAPQVRRLPLLRPGNAAPAVASGPVPSPAQLLAWRTSAGLSQRDLSALCGVQRSVIAGVETNRYPHGRVHARRCLAGALGHADPAEWEE